MYLGGDLSLSTVKEMFLGRVDREEEIHANYRKNIFHIEISSKQINKINFFRMNEILNMNKISPKRKVPNNQISK